MVRIFNAYADGMSYKEIASMLNQEGIPTSQSPRSKRQSTWSCKPRIFQPTTSCPEDTPFARRDS